MPAKEAAPAPPDPPPSPATPPATGLGVPLLCVIAGARRMSYTATGARFRALVLEFLDRVGDTVRPDKPR